MVEPSYLRHLHGLYLSPFHRCSLPYFLHSLTIPTLSFGFLTMLWGEGASKLREKTVTRWRAGHQQKDSMSEKALPALPPADDANISRNTSKNPVLNLTGLWRTRSRKDRLRIAGLAAIAILLIMGAFVVLAFLAPPCIPSLGALISKSGYYEGIQEI